MEKGTLYIVDPETGAYKEFGGITGDTEGWFVTVCEVAMTVAAAVAAVLMG